MVKVIFIASLSHSGSTLLDLMLNAHPDVASVGELKQLGRFARLEKPNRQLRCTCGAESLLSCEFWTRVSAHTLGATGRTIGELNVEDYDEVKSFDRDNAALFQAIASVSGKRYVVDSSKHVARLSLLTENPALDVFPIFLLRDPKGQICSSKKSSASLAKLIGNYVRTNREIHELVKDRPHSVVRYEELVQSPEPVLDQLMRQLGLSFDRQQLEWASQIRHNVGGNGMRRSHSSELKLDEKWRDHLTLLQKLAIDAGTLLGRYRYAKSVHPKTMPGAS
ncbi:sulfotransferase [Methyloceanibacter sp.]|uniref:sulfotransferase n=1 Tax=Methyloceanibacter sp. TaxID=1965321 RepID=UPI003D6C7465